MHPLALACLASVIAAATAACTVERRPDEALVGPPPLVPRAPAAPAPALPPELEARRVAAVERLRQGDDAGAVQALEALARDAGPTYAVANDLAVAHGLAGRWSDALAAADRALAVFPGVEARANKVEALLALGDRKSASRVARELVADHPEAASAHYALGATLLADGATSDARIAFDMALDRAPEDFGAALGVLACAAADTGAVEFDELAGRLLERSPEDPDVLYLMGAGQERRLDPEAAKKLYRRAIAAAGERGRAHPWAHWNLARLLEDQIDLAAARPHYQAFLDSAPAGALSHRQEAAKKLGIKPEVTPR